MFVIWYTYPFQDRNMSIVLLVPFSSLSHLCYLFSFFVVRYIYFSLVFFILCIIEEISCIWLVQVAVACLYFIPYPSVYVSAAAYVQILSSFVRAVVKGIVPLVLCTSGPWQ